MGLLGREEVTQMFIDDLFDADLCTTDVFAAHDRLVVTVGELLEKEKAPAM